MKSIIGKAAASACTGAVVASIVVLAAPAANAQAEAPVSDQAALGIVQAVTHDSNVYRGPGEGRDDWLSTTALELRVDQPLGSGRWRGEASLRAHRYAEQRELDSNDHRAALALDFQALPQLSGTAGAHTRRQRHRDGIDTATFLLIDPIETEHAAYVQTQWGGPGAWSLLAGADAVERRYTWAEESSNLRQHSVEAGAGWQPGPAFGGAFKIRGTRIDRARSITGAGGDVDRQEAEMLAHWQATPASRLQVRLAHVHEDRGLNDRSFWAGGVAWAWAPSATLRLRAEAFRDTEGLAGPQDPFDADTHPVRAGDVRRDGLRWTTQWAASDTTRLLASARLSVRQLDVPVSGVRAIDRTTAWSIELRHSPRRSLDLGCGLVHEKRDANWDSQGAWRSWPYESASVRCQVAWWHR